MQVRLIAVTQPVIDECATSGDLISYCARVSNPANQANMDTAPRLLSYLARNQHWSPFEMASMTLEIVTTRDIARQILRHRSFSFQEFSQRYAAVQGDAVIRDARMQDVSNRQNSVQCESSYVESWWQDAQEEIAALVSNKYHKALSLGIAKEVARSVLPEGMTTSTLYMAGTIRSWMHYVMLRTEAGTQKEHREIALECKRILIDEYPALADLLGAAA